MITLEINASGKTIATYTQQRARSVNVTRWVLSDNKAHFLRGFSGDASKVTSRERHSIGNALRNSPNHPNKG